MRTVRNFLIWTTEKMPLTQNASDYNCDIHGAHLFTAEMKLSANTFKHLEHCQEKFRKPTDSSECCWSIAVPVCAPVCTCSLSLSVIRKQKENRSECGDEDMGAN